MLVGVGLAVGLCFELLVPLQLYCFVFAAVFLLSYDEVLYVGVIVLLPTSKSKFLSQVFEVNIGQDFSIEITNLTFYPEGRPFLRSERLRFVWSFPLFLLSERNCRRVEDFLCETPSIVRCSVDNSSPLNTFQWHSA